MWHHSRYLPKTNNSSHCLTKQEFATVLCIHTSSWHTFYVCVFRGSLEPDASHVLVIDVDLNVGKIQKVKFLWNKHVISLFRPKLGASHITVQSGEDGTECVSFIPPKSYFLYLPLDLSVHTYVHPNAYLPILYPSTPPLSHAFLSIHLTTYLSTYPSIQPASQPAIHLPQLFILTLHLSSWFTQKNQTLFSLSHIQLGRTKTLVVSQKFEKQENNETVLSETIKNRPGEYLHESSELISGGMHLLI